MPSSEVCFARRLAVLYKQHDVLNLDRPSRVAFLQGEIDRLCCEDEIEQRAHAANCETCRAGRLCLASFSLSDAQVRRHYRVAVYRDFIRTEQKDQQYADHAKKRSVRPRDHKDGWCSYWQNLRARRFALNNWRCERPGCEAPAENCHHLHYNTLGYEELEDVRALCRERHATLHGMAA